MTKHEEMDRRTKHLSEATNIILSFGCFSLFVACRLLTDNIHFSFFSPNYNSIQTNLNIRVNRAETVVKRVGAENRDEVLATTILAYALSTLMTGAVFLSLGLFKVNPPSLHQAP